MPKDPAGKHYGPSRLVDGNVPYGVSEPVGPVPTVFMNLHVKCPIHSAGDDADMESHLLAVMIG